MVYILIDFQASYKKLDFYWNVLQLGNGISMGFVPDYIVPLIYH